MGHTTWSHAKTSSYSPGHDETWRRHSPTRRWTRNLHNARWEMQMVAGRGWKSAADVAKIPQKSWKWCHFSCKPCVNLPNKVVCNPCVYLPCLQKPSASVHGASVFLRMAGGKRRKLWWSLAIVWIEGRPVKLWQGIVWFQKMPDKGKR